MAILASGNTFALNDNVTPTTLNNAVNNATFATGAVDNATTQLSGGAIIVKDAGITTAKMSTGAPTWTSGGDVTVSDDLTVNDALNVTGNTTVGSSSGSNITLKEYTAGSARDWNVRDDNLIDRLRFARGGTDYAFWDVLKVAASDNVASQRWFVVTDYQWSVGGVVKLSLTANTLTFAGTTISAANLPTSAAGLASGDLWVDAAADYVVKRVP